MLAGLMSRWISPWPSPTRRPAATPSPTRTTSAGGSGPDRRMISASERPSMYSITT